MTLLWCQEPVLSSEPIEVLHYFLSNEKEQYFEAAVFKLKSNKYLYISFSRFGTEENTGITDCEEFDNFQEAVNIFKEMTE